jgi:hypothetical protein
MVWIMIDDLIEELTLPGEQYWLQTKEVIPNQNMDGNAFGSLEKDWVDVERLRGVIQKNSQDPQSLRGQEEIADYIGFFIPNFSIEENDLGEYRLKNMIPQKNRTYFVRYFRISKIDRNLALDNERSHYEIEAELLKEDDPDAFTNN